MQSTLNGVSVWFFKVFPALFPFFIATRLLIGLEIDDVHILDKCCNKLFKVSGAGKIFFLSILSGYPVGAKLISAAYSSKNIDSISAKKMMSFCSVSGPMFIVGSVGVGIFSDAKFGYMLLICHIIGAILNGILYRNSYSNMLISPIQKKLELKKDKSNLLGDAVLDSITSILIVAGYIVFAFVLIDLLNNIRLIPLLSKILSFNRFNPDIINHALNGCFEMTKGLIGIGSLGLNKRISFVISSFLIAFGGLSIFLQSTTFTSTLHIKKSFYLLQKLTQGLITMFVAIILSFFL